MVLEEAIKRLGNLAIHHRDATFPEDEKAINIGIESLKRELEWRRRWPHQSHLPFPGETKE